MFVRPKRVKHLNLSHLLDAEKSGTRLTHVEDVRDYGQRESRLT